jgi:hypothetical protein
MLDLPNLQHLPEARQLHTSLLAYMHPKKFNPKTAFKPELVANLFRDQSDGAKQKDIIDYSQFFNGNKGETP